MRKSLLLLAAALVFTAIGCGDDDDGSADTPTTVAAATDDTTGPSVDDVDSVPGDDAVAGDCASLAEAAAPAEATSSFPDNPDVEWAVDSVALDDDGRAVVEVVPTPDEVGYPRFRLVSACDDGDAVLLGTYALDGSDWLLLFTTDAATGIELEPTLP